MIQRKTIFTTLLLCLIALTQVMAQGKPKPEPLPIDTAVRYGRLSNGLTYYIRHNELPKNRADFYIAQNVGSILEEENQRGLAHFLEHMAFDGSRNFPDDGMDEYIESVGMRSGENFNAYTSFDETVYMITNAPVDKSGVVDSCLLILHDWSGCLTLTDSAIRKERGVIREEWRTRQDAQTRMWEQQLPKMFPGSRYANRMPIGTIDVIENFKPDELRAYYKKWYRPDLQALIIVGDVDVDAVERTIQRMFADIPAPVNPAERKPEPVPDNDAPIVSIATDKEADNTILYLFYKHDTPPREVNGTLLHLMFDYVQQICATIMAERFDEILHQANPPFIYAEAYDSDQFMIAKTKSAWTVAAIAKEGEIDSTLIAMVKETQRVKRYGFTESEYERARDNVMKQYESAYNERNNRRNDAYTREYVHHFTNGGYIPGIEMEYELLKQYVPKVTAEWVNMFLRDFIGEKNIVISLTGPEKEGVAYPTEEELLRVFEEASRMPVAPYEETVSNEPLIPAPPAPGQIVKTEENQRFGATVMTLGNGIKVVLKPTEFKKDEILMTATAPGGSTTFGAEDVQNLKVFNEAIELGGLGAFSAIDLGKRLAGKKVSCAVSLGLDGRLVNGMAAPSDLRTLFELIYLEFTAPRVDKEAFASFETRLKAQLESAELDPMTAFSDSLSRTAYGDNPRAARLRPTDFEHISYDRIMEMRKECFDDATGFVFTFVGNIQADSIRPLIEQYLATLPTGGKVSQGDETKVPTIRKGERVNRFDRPLEIPQVSVAHLYSGVTAYSLENTLAATATKQILDLIYYDKIREKEGGTYGVGVFAGIGLFPKGWTVLQIGFNTDPAKWESMNAIVGEELERLANEGPRPEDFQKTRDNLLKRHAEVLQENSHWLDVLDRYYYYGLDKETDYEATVRALTPEKIQSFVRDLLRQGNRVEVIMRPAE